MTKFALTETKDASELRADLHRVEEGAKLAQQHLPHVVPTTRVSQDQHWSPAAATGRAELQDTSRKRIFKTSPEHLM